MMTEKEIRREIAETTAAIKMALWGYFGLADMDRAKLLISKRMGLRIVLGERKVKLKKPIVHIIEPDSELLAA